MLILTVIVSLPFTLYLVLLSSSVQTYLTNKTTSWLKNEFGLNVSIRQINFRPINHLVIEDIYVEDTSGDTLAYIHSLTAGVEQINLKGPELYFSRVVFDSLKFHMQSDSLGKSNLINVIDLFRKKDSVVEKKVSNFRLYSHIVDLKRSEYVLRKFNPEKTQKINFGDLKLGNLNVEAQPFDLRGDTIIIDIKKLSTIDHCGLKVDNMSTVFCLEPRALKFENFNTMFGQTNVNSEYVRLIQLTDTAFANFENEVSFDVNLFSSDVTTDDLAWFAPELKKLDLKAKIKGKVTGPLSNLYGDNLLIEVLDSTKLHTSLKLRGLPDVENMFFDADIKNLTTSYSQLAQLTVLKDSLGSPILPPELSCLERINYKSFVSGNMSNISSVGTFNTNIGSVFHNISYNQNDMKQINLNGLVQLNNFGIGVISGTYPMLDKIDTKINISSVLNPNKTFSAQLKTLVSHVDFENYPYKNIEIEGKLTDKFYDGSITIDDPNVELDFMGKVEYGTKRQHHKFILNLSKFNLYPLGLDSDSASRMQFDMVANLYGINPDSIIGTVNMYDVYITRKGEEANFVNLDLNFDRKGISKTLSVNSEYIGVLLSGQYTYNTVSDVLSDAVKQYMPAVAWSDEVIQEDDFTNIQLKIDLHNVKPVVNLFDTALTVSNNSYLDIRYKASGRKFDMKGLTSKVAYQDMYLNNISFSGYNEATKIIANISADNFFYYQDMSLKNLSLNTILESNLMTFNVNWNNYNREDTTNYSGYISSQILFPESGNFDRFGINILSSNIVISDTTWSISPSVVKVNGSEIEFDNFAIGHRNQHLYINGIISNDSNDTLFVNTKSINLEMLNVLLKNKFGISVEGVLTADIAATNLYENPFVLAQIDLDNLKYNGQLIGDTKISSSWDPLLEMIKVDWVSTIQNYDVLYIVGDYSPDNSNVNFRLFVDRFDLSILNPYLEGVLHDLTGLTTAEMIIKGNLKAPKMEGVIILDRCSFVLDYTKTRYQITDWIDISPDAIIFSDLRVVDNNNNNLLVSGRVTHNNFDSLGLDVRFNATNFMFLNTLEKDNSKFFGTVFASGNGTVKGKVDNLDISMGIKTEPNTRLFIPLNSGGTVNQTDYIVFKQPKEQLADKNRQVPETKDKSESEINLMMNLEVTPEAEVQIIFDPAIGDIIKAKGSSNLTIYMPPKDDLEIYGDYIISEGDYLFTLQDVFQKRFAIAKGSSITWSGDPANANIDIDAVYKVRRANLYDLTFNSEDEGSRISADAHLLMTGTFTAPNINFKVTLPASAEAAQDQINALQSDEISKQVISLLVLNRFQPLPGAVKVAETTGPSSVESNASELLSNQVSNWLSQISRSFDIGFNYTPGGEVSSHEYELAVSTQILNNRVTINTNLGMGGEQIGQSSSSGTNIAGDFEMEVKLDKRGKIMFKGYHKTDNNYDSHSKQGAGVFYREEFNTLNELWGKFFRRKSK